MICMRLLLDVAYALKSSAKKLDLYLPNEGKGPFPLIIEIHLSGGARFPAAIMAATSGDVASLVDPAPGTSEAMGAANSSNFAESKYLGKIIGTTEAQPLVEAASPQTCIGKKSPPMYIQHGTADRNIPITQSINFSKKLAMAGNNSMLPPVSRRSWTSWTSA
jgi:hypothetical protein